jgi:hypothetical protein
LRARPGAAPVVAPCSREVVAAPPPPAAARAVGGFGSSEKIARLANARAHARKPTLSFAGLSRRTTPSFSLCFRDETPRRTQACLHFAWSPLPSQPGPGSAWHYLVRSSRVKVVGHALFKQDYRASKVSVCPKKSQAYGKPVHPGR